MTTARIELPPKLVDLFDPVRGELRFRVAYGGRGSGKSFTFALMAAVWGYAEPLRILCTRELQISIKESMFAELKNAIQTFPWLEEHYDVGEAFIRGKNGTEFIFRGLRHNMSAIKSMAQIDLCIVEEAADVPDYSWQALLPTIRAPRSEVWAIYNPKHDSDPVDLMFRQNPPPRCMAVEVNWNDNPYFPPELDEQRRHAQRVMNPADYAWIWEGAYLENSDAQVLAGKYDVDAFEPQDDWDGPYFGLDWGFSTDPTAITKCWVSGDDLLIEREAGKTGLELDETGRYAREAMPGIERYVVRADNARPESISHVKKHTEGMPRIEAAPKWPGSIEDGVAHLRSYRRIIIHPRCKETIREARLYSYKVDRLSGDVLPQIEDKHNHYIDSIRYALAPLIRGKPASGILLPKRRR
ncbi:MAG: PBSX family phage terminase large subunit [Corynebacterium casei]|nr:PBSX family phage terminase large subunit [Corynebacterium casei]